MEKVKTSIRDNSNDRLVHLPSNLGGEGGFDTAQNHDKHDQTAFTGYEVVPASQITLYCCGRPVL